jgi:copper(I)-binding protein
MSISLLDNESCLLGFVLLTVVGFAGCSAERGATESSLEISRAYVAEPVLGERAAMYFTVDNRGDADDELVAVSTPVAGVAEIHRTVSDGGMMRMERVESLEIPTGEQVRLAPGGYHIMLLELRDHIISGDAIDATLRFRRAGEVAVRARVLSLAEIEDVIGTAGEHARHGTS